MRRSKYEHLKGQVFELFGQGLTPAQVRSQHPAIASSTLYEWFEKFKTESFRKKPETAFPSEDEALYPPLVSYLCPADCDRPSDEIKQIKRAIWRHCKKPNDNSTVAIQGLNAYLRAMHLENSLPLGDEPELSQQQRIEKIAQAIDRLKDTAINP